MESVSIPSGRHTLAGLYHQPHQPDGRREKKAVLMVHGFALDMHELGVFDAAVERIVAEGFSVLRFDLPGMGKSSGTLMDVTFDELKQAVQDAYDFLKQTTPQISLLAASFGNACALSTVCKFGCIISFNPTVKGEESWRHLFTLAAERGWIEDFEAGKAVRLKNGLTVGPQLIDALRGLSLCATISHNHAPLLVVHGTADQYIPLTHAQELLAAHPGVHELLAIEHARHGFRIDPGRSMAIDAACGWLARYS